MDLKIVTWLAIFAAVFADEENVTIDPRIVNGQNAQVGQFPYQALLNILANNGQYALGGGSLISCQWVLTAAHCINNIKEVTVRLGAIDRNFAPWQTTVPVSWTIIYPYYDAANTRNDIGLIRIPCVQYTDRIRPIALPGFSSNSDYAGENGVISGFGLVKNNQFVNRLQYAVVPILSNAQCSRYANVVPSLICTSGQPSSVCGGDSGGPLVARGVIVGVTSFTLNGCEAGYPNGFARVSSFLRWIYDTTGIWYP